MGRKLLVENIMQFIPSIHKRLFKGLTSFEISRQQSELLFIISHKNGRTMSYYSEKTMISKPNLTIIADKLIDEGYVERGFDKDDRRIITLNITDKGLEYLEKVKKIVIESISAKLDNLSDSDVDRLNSLFAEINSIFAEYFAKEEERQKGEKAEKGEKEKNQTDCCLS